MAALGLNFWEPDSRYVHLGEEKNRFPLLEIELQFLSLPVLKAVTQ